MSFQYYSEHGLISDPKENANLLDALPSDVSQLCPIIQQLLIHPYMPPRRSLRISKKRQQQMEIRCATDKLSILKTLNDKPLYVPREESQRLVGCCRDYALLLCAALRQERFPTRVRYGFAKYFGLNFFTDHVICEYWSNEGAKWIRTDAQLDSLQCKHYGIHFDPTKIPHGQFLTAGELWRLFRSGRADPGNVGLDCRLNLRGIRFVVSSLVRDFASLNKIELLCMDSWGLADKETLSEEDYHFLDNVAELATATELNQAKIKSLFNKDERLSLAAGVKCYSSRGVRLDKVIEC
jgi:hypothetical protein